MHHNGKVASVVGFSKEVDAEIARGIAIQVATMNPVSVSEKDCPAEIVEKEVALYKEQMKDDPKMAGKPEAMLEQIFREDIRNLSYECGLEHDIMLRFPESITLKFNPVYKERQYNVFAIPKDEFKYNSALTDSDQNPGYSAN